MLIMFIFLVEVEGRGPQRVRGQRPGWGLGSVVKSYPVMDKREGQNVRRLLGREELADDVVYL